jgi:hypothetical protein
MREMFKWQTFRRSSAQVIEQANGIIEEYLEAGFTLTLRQLYYQFVARRLLPNKQKEYKRLGSIINDARLAGLVDWNAIEDRTRYLRSFAAAESPEQAITDVAAGYCIDLWEGQEYRPEIWIEKDALIGVIEPACGRWRIPYFACRGYTSQSEQYRAGKRFQRYAHNGYTPLILHFGDHDPSGIDMTRDNSDRVELFAEMGVEVKRMALNMDQVEQYNPPPNPAKETDSRAAGYIEQYGDESWELDALDPKVIDALIEGAIQEIVDHDKWAEMQEREEREQDQLKDVVNNWDGIQEWLKEQE